MYNVIVIDFFKASINKFGEMLFFLCKCTKTMVWGTLKTGISALKTCFESHFLFIQSHAIGIFYW